MSKSLLGIGFALVGLIIAYTPFQETIKIPLIIFLFVCQLFIFSFFETYRIRSERLEVEKKEQEQEQNHESSHE